MAIRVCDSALHANAVVTYEALAGELGCPICGELSRLRERVYDLQELVTQLESALCDYEDDEDFADVDEED